MSAFVKICGLQTTEQVAAAVVAGADAIGFVFADSVRQVTPELAAKLSAAIPNKVKTVAVMLHPSDDELQAVLRRFRPDVLQTDVIDFPTLNVPDAIEQWPVFREGKTPPSANGVYVYEGPKSGRGETVDWSRAAAFARQGNMLLAGGLSAKNVGSAIKTVRPFGVDVSSGVESSPGQKDPGLINEFVMAVRAAEKDL